MNKNKLILVSGILLVGALCIVMVNRNANKTEASVNQDMYEAIDQDAFTAQQVGDAGSIENLVDTIFEKYQVSGLDTSLRASLKDRIVRAEQNGNMSTESQVAQAVNWLNTQFAAPSYAQTSLMQTRALRLDMNNYMPNLFVEKDTQGNIGVYRPENSEISSQMNACQAVNLLLVIVQQKMLNSEFQKDPAQWDTDFQADWEAGVYDNPGSQETQLIARPAPEKNLEMKQVVFNANLTSSQISNIAHGTLDQLGIPR